MVMMVLPMGRAFPNTEKFKTMRLQLSVSEVINDSSRPILDRRQTALRAKFYPNVLKHFLQLVRDKEYAELLADEVFVKVWKTDARLTSTQLFEAVLTLTICQYTCELTEALPTPQADRPTKRRQAPRKKKR